jgi:hypothetical protein
MRYLFFTLLLFMTMSSVYARPPEISEGMRKLMEDARTGSIEGNAFMATLQKLVDKKDPVAQFVLGARIMDAEPENAKKLLQESVAAGCPAAAGFLGMLLLAEKATAPGLDFTRSAAGGGNSLAQVALASFYLNGSQGIAKDRVEAFAWLRLAERQTYSAGEWGSVVEKLLSMKGELSKKELKQAEARYAALAKTVPVASYHLCGQSVPDIDRDFERHNYDAMLASGAADYSVDNPTVVVNAGDYDLLIPAGFERLVGKPTIAGQYVYSKPHPVGTTGSLIQLISIDYDRARFPDRAEAEKGYLEVLLYGLGQKHQQFSSKEARFVQADIGNLLVARWDGQNAEKNFSGFTGVGVINDKVLMVSILDLRDNFEKFSGKYLLSIQSLRPARPEKK